MYVDDVFQGKDMEWPSRVNTAAEQAEPHLLFTRWDVQFRVPPTVSSPTFLRNQQNTRAIAQ